PARGLPAGGSGEAARYRRSAESVAGTSRPFFSRKPRRPAGTDAGGGEPSTRLQAGCPKRRSARGGRGDDSRAERAPLDTLGDRKGTASRGDLPAFTGQTGGNPQTRRRGKAAGH